MLPSLLLLPILLSLSLLWWLALGVTAAAHLLWWPLLCCLRGISFCSSSAVSSSSYSCYGCCQLLLSLLGVSVQLVLVHLRFFHSRESLLGVLQTVPQLCHELGDCGQPPEFRPGSITGGSVSGGCHRLHLFPGFYVGGAHLPAAVDSRRVSVLRLAYRELMAIATRRPFFTGSPSSWRQTVDAVPPALPPSILGSSGSGGSSVCVDGVSSRPPVVAPSPSSSLGVSLCRVSPDLHFWSAAPDVGWGAHLDHQIASGLWDAHQAALSINARDCLLSNWVFSSSSLLYRVARWLSFATTPQQWLLFARKVAHDPLSSPPWLRRSCDGRCPSPSAWLRSSSRAPTTSSRMPCLALTSSHIQRGHYF